MVPVGGERAVDTASGGVEVGRIVRAVAFLQFGVVDEPLLAHLAPESCIVEVLVARACHTAVAVRIPGISAGNARGIFCQVRLFGGADAG